MQNIQDYLKTDKIKDLPQQVKDKITLFRTTYEFMPFEMFIELVKQSAVKRIIKTKKPRTLLVDEQGNIWYFENYVEDFVKCGFFLAQ